MRHTQIPLFAPDTEWVMPEELKDLKGYKEIAIDLETNDPGLIELGSGNVVGGDILQVLQWLLRDGLDIFQYTMNKVVI